MKKIYGMVVFGLFLAKKFLIQATCYLNMQ